MTDQGILNNAIEAIKNGSTARPLKKTESTYDDVITQSQTGSAHSRNDGSS
jgi:hypothetical protein